VEIRQMSDEERSTRSIALQEYGFQPSPASDAQIDQLRKTQKYYTDNITLVVEESGVTLAEASAIPMWQNIRGSVYSMAGIAGVATHPLARRRGHVRRSLASHRTGTTKWSAQRHIKSTGTAVI
jgi:predicted acetyltransferase